MNRGKDRLSFSVNGHATELVNEGTINMGKGCDQIDLVTGLLAGKTKIKLGQATTCSPASANRAC